jgi:RimJ/RimL family protein N-acetyltransferase
LPGHDTVRVLDSSFALLTERLRLRPLTPDDRDSLLAILGDADTMRWYPEPYDRAGVSEWIDRAVASYGKLGFGLLGVEERESGEFLGDCGPTIQPVDGELFVELGWHVRRDRWGRGIAPEAGAACRDWVFAAFAPPCLISLIRPENRQSWRVAEQLGMTVWKETDHAGLRHRVYRVDRPQ